MRRQILGGLLVACSAAFLVTAVAGRVAAQDTPKDLKTLDKLEGYDQLPGEKGVKKAMEAVPDQPIETVIVWSEAQPSTGKAPLTVKFSADPVKGATTYEWTFGDGSAPAAGTTASHTFAKAGTYRVLLKVTGPGGLLGEDEHRIKVAQ